MTRRIGITQRVEVVSAYDERRDCLDQKWFVLMETLGLAPVAVPNSLTDVVTWCRSMQLDGIVLSGGNDLAHLPDASGIAPERDTTELQLLDYARSTRLPVLGVCRGMQIMSYYLGGSLSPATGHAGCRHELLAADAAWRLSDFGGQSVNSFHNWAIPADGLGEGLIAELLAPSGEVEGSRHRDLPWLGIMWHPEREAPFRNPDLHLFTSLFRS